jgi:hypothetical protein
MSTLPSLFNDFLSNIRPTDEQENYIEGHKTLRNNLQSSDDVDDFYVADFLQGSYRRWTALKPQQDEKSDVDVVLVTDLHPEDYDDAADALQECEPFLEEHYEGQWEPNAHSYKIEEDEIEIDLVLTVAPSEATREAAKALGSLDVETALTADADDSTAVANALNISATDDDEWKQEPLKVPDRDENEWEKTHPLATINFTLHKNDATDGHYVNVVKAIKWWRRTQTPDVEGPTSYPLEHIIGYVCPNDIDSVAEGVTLTLEAIVDRFETHAHNEQTPVLSAHGLPDDPEYDVLKRIEGEDFAAFYREVEAAAELARTALNEQEQAKSSEHWQELFGDEFPPFGSDEDSDDRKDKAMALGSSSEATGASDHQFA